jgi:hypothetical protein
MNKPTFIKLNNHRPGIALLVAIGTMLIILIVASLAIYLVTRAMNVTGGQKRYQTCFEAAEGGLDIGLSKVDSAFTHHTDPTGYAGVVGKYNVTVTAEPQFAATASGAAIKFARGYFGVGHGLAGGGVNLYYHVLSQAVALGTTGERVILELQQKKVVGID